MDSKFGRSLLDAQMRGLIPAKDVESLVSWFEKQDAAARYEKERQSRPHPFGEQIKVPFVPDLRIADTVAERAAEEREHRERVEGLLIEIRDRSDTSTMKKIWVAFLVDTCKTLVKNVLWATFLFGAFLAVKFI